MIAGHTFVGPLGRCSCGKCFADISVACRDDIGTHGWAHSGSLVEREYIEIDNERDRLWRLVVGVCSGVAAREFEPEYPMFDDANMDATVA